MTFDAFHGCSRYKDGKQPICKQCTVKMNKDYKAANPHKPRERLLAQYGLTPEQYATMLEEQGGCAICKTPVEPARNTDNLTVDHDHNTGNVRGLLCNKCNRGIGLLCDSPEIVRSALDYLLKHKQETPT
jgi:hypothetical protein